MTQTPEVPPSMARIPQKRGRRSVASLSVVAVGPPPSPVPPPANLGAHEALYWRTIVQDWPADRFDGCAQILLTHLCHYLRNCAVLSDEVRDLLAAPPAPDKAKRLRLLRKEYREEGAAAERLATRLRLTPQSRYTPAGAARSALRVVPARPWEEDDSA